MSTYTAQRCALEKKEIARFLIETAATENFSGGSRQLYVMNADRAPRLISWYRQQPEKIADAVNGLAFWTDSAYYVTKNSFVANERRENALFSLDSIVIDCDAHGSKLTDSEYHCECSRLILALDDDDTGRIPAVSAVTYSGRGLHLWILLESFSAKLLNLYKFFAASIADAVQRVCNEIDSPFSVDKGASCNASGLIRCAGTVNQSAGRTAVFEMRSGKRYSLDILQECCAVNVDAKHGQRYERKHGDRTLDESERRSKYRPLNRKRMHFLECIVKSTPHQTGRRALLLFAYCNAAFCFFSDADSTESAAIRFNARFDEPLPAAELHKALKSVIQCGGYDFTIDNFFTMISADSTEIYLYDNLTSQRDAIRTEKRNAKSERNAKIIELYQKGESCRQIAEKTACDFSTVSRVIKRNETRNI